MRRFTEAEHVVQKSSTVSTEQPKNGRLSLKTIDFQKYTTLNVFVYYCYLLLFILFVLYSLQERLCIKSVCEWRDMRRCYKQWRVSIGGSGVYKPFTVQVRVFQGICGRELWKWVVVET